MIVAALFASAEKDVLSEATRAPIALLIGAPRAEGAFTSKGEVRSSIVERLEADTAFVALDAPDALLESCKGAIRCIARALPAEARAARMLLIVILVDRAEGARLDVTLVDIPRAHELAHEDDESGAVLARRPDLPTKDVIELGASVRGLFENDLRPIFEPGGMWRSFGALEIHGARAGLELLIDGVSVGRTQLGTTRVADVRVGSRSVVVRDADGKETQALAMVQVGAVSPIDFRQHTSAALAREVTFWSGVGTAAAGVVIVAVAAVGAGSRPDAVCFHGSPGCTEDQVFAGNSASYAGGLSAPMNSGGLLLGPFGLGLTAFGGTTAVTTQLFGSEDELPWIQVAIGVVAGLATYGLCAAVD